MTHWLMTVVSGHTLWALHHVQSLHTFNTGNRHSLAVYSCEPSALVKTGGTSQKAEHQGAGQSQARMYYHQEGIAMTYQHELYQHPCHENTGHQLACPWSTRAPGPAVMDLITSVRLEQTVIAGDTLHVDKSYLGAIQRVFMYKCLHKLLRSNVT